MAARRRISGPIVLGALLGAGVTVACSKPAVVEPARIARASPIDQERIRAAERELDRARDGLGRAEFARSAAEEFQRAVQEERRSAEREYSAAARSAALGEGTVDANLATSVERRRDAAALASEELEAKARFADDLLELREKEAELAEADVKLQRTLVERAKFEAAEQAGSAEGLKRADFVEAEEEARVEFGEALSAVAGARQRSNESRKAWLLARNRALESAR